MNALHVSHLPTIIRATVDDGMLLSYWARYTEPGSNRKLALYTVIDGDGHQRWTVGPVTVRDWSDQYAALVQATPPDVQQFILRVFRQTTLLPDDESAMDVEFNEVGEQCDWPRYPNPIKTAAAMRSERFDFAVQVPTSTCMRAAMANLPREIEQLLLPVKSLQLGPFEWSVHDSLILARKRSGSTINVPNSLRYYLAKLGELATRKEVDLILFEPETDLNPALPVCRSES